MYPASFDYVAPASLEEAISLLDKHGYDAKVVAGGQSLIPLMKFRFASPAVLRRGRSEPHPADEVPVRESCGTSSREVRASSR